jgi:hypothetical protein
MKNKLYRRTKGLDMYKVLMLVGLGLSIYLLLGTLGTWAGL